MNWDFEIAALHAYGNEVAKVHTKKIPIILQNTNNDEN